MLSIIQLVIIKEVLLLTALEHFEDDIAEHGTHESEPRTILREADEFGIDSNDPAWSMANPIKDSLKGGRGVCIDFFSLHGTAEIPCTPERAARRAKEAAH